MPVADPNARLLKPGDLRGCCKSDAFSNHGDCYRILIIPHEERFADKVLLKFSQTLHCKVYFYRAWWFERYAAATLVWMDGHYQLPHTASYLDMSLVLPGAM